LTLTEEADFPVLLTASLSADDEELDGYLWVFGPWESGDETLLEIARHDDDAYPELDPVLRTYLFEPGDYYVLVAPMRRPGDPTEFYDSVSCIDLIASGLTYDLTIEVAPASAPVSAFEPNDTIPTPVGDTPFLVKGEFIGDGPNVRLDVDRYKFSVSAPSVISVEARPAGLGALDPILSADVFGSELQGRDSGRANTRTQVLKFAMLEAGSGIINVRGTFGAPMVPPNDPDGLITLGSVGYYDLVIDVEAAPVTPGGPHEPNDSIYQAAKVGAEGPGVVAIKAQIGDGLMGAVRGDVDFYEIRLGIDERLVLDLVRTQGGSDFAPTAHLFDYLGVRLASWSSQSDGVISVEYRRTVAASVGAAEETADVLYLAIMGSGDRSNFDPFFPYPEQAKAGAFPVDLALDGGGGSKGEYLATITIASDPLPLCDPEPNDAFEDLEGKGGPASLTGEGRFHCVGGVIGNGDCVLEEYDVDLFRVTVDEAPSALRVLLTNIPVNFNIMSKSVRVFNEDGSEIVSTTSGLTNLNIPLVILTSTGDFPHVA
jgi:hypothetical protein